MDFSKRTNCHGVKESRKRVTTCVTLAQVSLTLITTDDCKGSSAGQGLLPTREGF